jgi:ribulose-phosphate 3-epimerase
MSVRRLLAPSILSADFASLGRAVAAVEAHSGLLHVDVMDGHFVPNITLGPPVVACLREATSLPLDCHLMIESPDRYLKDFAAAGAGYLSVHQEACPHLHRTVQTIAELGMKPGVAINPATPVETLEEILEDLAFVLVMSVNPGFGGQKFIPGSLGKIRKLRRIAKDRGLELAVEVDGGVSPATVPSLLEAGASWFVAGSAVFHAPDPAEAARLLAEMIHG